MKNRTRSLPVAACVCCEIEGPINGRGLIQACYLRNWRAGTLDQFPIDPAARLEKRREWARKGREAYSQIRDGRVEDYADLRAWGETREQAAARLGVTERTAQRYECMLREQVSA